MHSFRTATAFAALALATAACGTDPNTAAPETASGHGLGESTPAETRRSPSSELRGSTTTRSSALAITVVDDRGIEVQIESTDRVVPVDGDLAEIVFALGLGDRVVATDVSATYPAAADALPEIGYQRALSAEPILSHEPTLVLATDVAGPAETLDDLERLGVPVVLIPNDASASGPADKVRAVAAALGVPDDGRRLADELQAEIDHATAIADSLPTRPRVAALYLRGEGTQLLLGEGSGLDWLLDAAGAVNVADELGVIDSAPINTEALVKAAPEVIVVPTAGLASVGGVDGLLDVAGIAQTPAGQDRRVHAYDDQYLLGTGPRTGALLTELIDDLHGGST